VSNIYSNMFKYLFQKICSSKPKENICILFWFRFNTQPVPFHHTNNNLNVTDARRRVPDPPRPVHGWSSPGGLHHREVGRLHAVGGGGVLGEDALRALAPRPSVDVYVHLSNSHSIELLWHGVADGWIAESATPINEIMVTFTLLAPIPFRILLFNYVCAYKLYN
jgi:hypothetical protein